MNILGLFCTHRKTERIQCTGVAWPGIRPANVVLSLCMECGHTRTLTFGLPQVKEQGR